MDEKRLVEILIGYLERATEPNAEFEDKNNIPAVARLVSELISKISEKTDDDAD